MLKFGTVTNINPLTAKARVQFSDDDITSYWLPIIQHKTLKDKFYSIQIATKVSLVQQKKCAYLQKIILVKDGLKP